MVYHHSPLGQDVTVFTAIHGDQPEDAVEDGVRVIRPRTYDVSGSFPGVVDAALEEWGGFFNDLYLSNLLWVGRVLDLVLHETNFEAAAGDLIE